MNPIDLSKHPIHLDRAAGAASEPEFTGSMDWYEAYVRRRADDGAAGRLVSLHSFDRPWDSWEMHPAGSEVVLCVAGEITLHQELGEAHVQSIVLRHGQYAINAAGVWHTADVAGPATAVFITSGWGTRHRPR